MSESAHIARHPCGIGRGHLAEELSTTWGPDKFLSSQPLSQYILMGETAPEVRDDREVARWGPDVSTATVYNSYLNKQQ